MLYHLLIIKNFTKKLKSLFLLNFNKIILNNVIQIIF
uniref:Uncharacterized protein n=1 Tax=Moumouvirus sp. 'Monve' TaxID=1128131 RepID=H2EFM8_9VIRU|nr:hypothetical protein mv_R1091 [Moumouvirus Monve]